MADKKYDSIINMDYPPEGPLLFGHPRMLTGDRAKIFSPFAALKGFEEAIEDTGKLHEELVNSKEPAMKSKKVSH